MNFAHGKNPEKNPCAQPAHEQNTRRRENVIGGRRNEGAREKSMQKIHASNPRMKNSGEKSMQKSVQKSMRNFMRQICASKLFRRNAQNKKSMHPQNEKPMQKNHAPNLCVKVLPKKGAQNEKSMHPQNEKVMQEFVRSFSLPQAWKRALPMPHNSAIEKPLLMKKLNRMAAFAPPRSPQGLGGQSPRPGDKLNWP